MLFDNLKENAIFPIKTPNLRRLSSPHPWGCFHNKGTPGWSRRVFPTPVGVFPHTMTYTQEQISLPHTRGGVSLADTYAERTGQSSPHPWGCFRRAQEADHRAHVFPTPVGVFLLLDDAVYYQQGLPHTRGGVSLSHVKDSGGIVSSPHPWGCFLGVGRIANK